MLPNLMEIITEYKNELVDLYDSGLNKKDMGMLTKGSIRICEAQVLYAIIRKFGYKNILEIGTGNGFSAVYLSSAIHNFVVDGRVDSVDICDRVSEKGLRFLFEHLELDKIAHFHVGDSSDVIPALSFEYDLILIDGSHEYEQTKRDFKNSYSKLRPGGCIAFHDIYKRPFGDLGPRNILDEITSNPDLSVVFFTEEMFDFFSYDEDVKDVHRISEKWRHHNYSYVDPSADPKCLMAVVFKNC